MEVTEGTFCPEAGVKRADVDKKIVKFVLSSTLSAEIAASE